MSVLFEAVASHACVLPGKSQETFSWYKISCEVFFSQSFRTSRIQRQANIDSVAKGISFKEENIDLEQSHN